MAGCLAPVQQQQLATMSTPNKVKREAHQASDEEVVETVYLASVADYLGCY